MDVEASNLRQIEALNQRGGRTLTIVDLLRAETLTPLMAACAMRAIEQGASILTAAKPSGAGKSTLLAALLHVLPPGEPIVTVDRPEVIAEGLRSSPDRPVCYLAHEIGPGRWYGYVWGRDVPAFLSLIQGSRRIASCLHADTLEELRAVLTGPPLHATRKQLGKVGLILFMYAGVIGGRFRHRVSYFYEADGKGGHRLLFRWDQASDSFLTVESPSAPETLGPYQRFLERLVQEGEVEATVVREKVLRFYRRIPRE
jgi:energy-coupling factor transporter ATP-binding protein EcfA2